MIIALVAGQGEDGKFPGRNTFPLLGKPMMAYPILAAQHAGEVDRVFLTTDSPAIERVAAGMGVTTLPRSPEVSGPSVASDRRGRGSRRAGLQGCRGDPTRRTRRRQPSRR